MNGMKEALKDMPTLHEGHTDNLKIQTPNYRVWLSREDGTIFIERLRHGRWSTVDMQDDECSCVRCTGHPDPDDEEEDEDEGTFE